jgi:hypothetical protein
MTSEHLPPLLRHQLRVDPDQNLSFARFMAGDSDPMHLAERSSPTGMAR